MIGKEPIQYLFTSNSLILIKINRSSVDLTITMFKSLEIYSNINMLSFYATLKTNTHSFMTLHAIESFVMNTGVSYT